MLLELSRRGPAGGEEGGAVAVGVLVYQRNRLVQRVHLQEVGGGAGSTRGFNGHVLTLVSLRTRLGV